MKEQLLDCTYIDVTVKSHTLKHLGGKFSERFAHISKNEFFGGAAARTIVARFVCTASEGGQIFFLQSAKFR